jgi:hypothetical protein
VKAAAAGALLLVTAAPAAPCTITHLATPEELVSTADAIVRVTAVEYAKAPPPPGPRVDGDVIRREVVDTIVFGPQGVVRFRVDEVVKGEDVPSVLEMHAELVDHNDFNDKRPPYTFVRPSGRRGSCFTSEYRPGASYLLFLKRGQGDLHVLPEPLAPVNEQLRSRDDKWVRWVRRKVRGR